MALLQNVIKGRQPVPPRLMIYGSEGVGKSTFAANAPKAVFVQTEDGLSEIDTAKFPLCATYAKNKGRSFPRVCGSAQRSVCAPPSALPFCYGKIQAR